MRFNLKTGRVAALIAGAAVAATIAAAPARAESVGQLQCNVSPGVGQIIVSSRQVSCTFRSDIGPAQLYSGSINRLGVDIGEISGGTIVYNVIALGTAGPGALSGDYVGPGFGVTLGTGAGLNALVGGGNNAFSLQPLAATTSTGVNINAGIGALRLVYAGPAVGPRARHARRHHRRYHRHH